MPIAPALAIVIAFVFLLASVVVSAALDSPGYVTASLLVLTALSLLTLLAAVAQDLELIPAAWRERKPSETSTPPRSRPSEPEAFSASGSVDGINEEVGDAVGEPPARSQAGGKSSANDGGRAELEDTLDEETQQADMNETVLLPDPEHGGPGKYEYSPEVRAER